MIGQGKRLRTYVLSVCLVAATVATAAGVTVYVPGDYPTIQAAINAVSSGDEIVVLAGTYNEAIDLSGKAITVRSANGPSVTVIDATGLGTSVVTCASSEGSDTVLDGFTITGGVASMGGGMHNHEASPTVTRCTFTGNSAGYGGGGMNNWDSHPTVTDCTFSGNSAGSSGGGMLNSGTGGSSPTVANCTFSGNWAGNPSIGSGGGIHNEPWSAPLVTHCLFINNATTTLGGGIYDCAANPTVTHCIFLGNDAGIGGGMTHHGGTFEVANSIFSGNQGGGLVNWCGGTSSVVNSVFTGNEAFGLNNKDNLTLVTNSILWGNTGTQILDDHGYMTAEHVTYSCVQDDEAGDGIVWPCTSLPCTPGEGNIDIDPLLTDADGDDDTFGTDDDDAHLLAGSPCIDAGDNDALLVCDVDADGNDRYWDDPATTDTGNGIPPIVDMGAHEYGSPPAPDCNADGIPDQCPSQPNPLPFSASAEGSRYIGVTPPFDVDEIALLVFADNDDPDVECIFAYVQADGTLGESPVMQAPEVWCRVHVHGPEIIPDTVYHVMAFDGTSWSDPIAVTTSIWGDVDGDGVVTGTDLDLALLYFQGDQSVPLGAVDMYPPPWSAVPPAACVGPDETLNVSDIQLIIHLIENPLTPYPCPSPVPGSCPPCESDPECSDAVECTVDTCTLGECFNVPDDSACPDNGVFCDGEEVCDPQQGCVSTGYPCWPRSCDEVRDRCGKIFEW